MNKKEIEAKLKEIIKKINEKEDDVIDNIADNNEDLTKYGMNSLVFIKIAVALEKELNIKFNSEMLNINKLKTLQSIIDYTESLILSGKN